MAQRMLHVVTLLPKDDVQEEGYNARVSYQRLRHLAAYHTHSHCVLCAATQPQAINPGISRQRRIPPPQRTLISHRPRGSVRDGPLTPPPPRCLTLRTWKN